MTKTEKIIIFSIAGALLLVLAIKLISSGGRTVSIQFGEKPYVTYEDFQVRGAPSDGFLTTAWFTTGNTIEIICCTNEPKADKVIEHYTAKMDYLTQKLQPVYTIKVSYYYGNNIIITGSAVEGDARVIRSIILNEPQ